MKTNDGQVFLSPSTQTKSYAGLREIHDEIHALAGDHWNWPLAASLSRPSLARILNLNFLYDEMLPVSGSICEFGVHYGSSLSILQNLRAIKEPYNYGRHIFGFDTFSGFSGSHEKDGRQVSDGDFNIGKGYEKTLDRLLSLQESLSPNSHIKKFSLIKGDASETISIWLNENPHALVSMGIFDMDIYKPTKEALRLILPRMPKGALLVFDELNAPHFPGETQALLETLDISHCMIRRSLFYHSVHTSGVQPISRTKALINQRVH